VKNLRTETVERVGNENKLVKTDTKVVGGVTLYRIKALTAVGRP
jgi:hypothetical protein